MSDLITLEDIDVDGSVREAEANLDGDTRASFFRKAAMAGGATIGGGALLGGFPGIALGASSKAKKNDAAILNYALTLEHLENEFYKAVIKSGIVKTAAYAKLVGIVQKDEAAHVKALPTFIKSLGGKPVKVGKYDFSKALKDEKTALTTAATLEDTGVAAYAGQGPNIKTGKAVIVPALGIHSVEARHAAALRAAIGKSPVVRPVDKPLSKSAVLKAVGKTGFVK